MKKPIKIILLPKYNNKYFINYGYYKLYKYYFLFIILFMES